MLFDLTSALVTRCRTLSRGFVEYHRERDGDVEAFDGRLHRDAYALVGHARFFIRQPSGFRAHEDGVSVCPDEIGVSLLSRKIGAHRADAVRAAPSDDFREVRVRPQRETKTRPHRAAQGFR